MRIRNARIIEAVPRTINAFKKLLRRIRMFESHGYRSISEYPKTFKDLVERFNGYVVIILEKLR